MSVEGEGAALAFLSVSVGFCRSKVRARLLRLCRYLSHFVGQWRERGKGAVRDTSIVFNLLKKR